MEEQQQQQQQDQSPIHIGRQKHGGRKGHHHLRVRGHRGRCGGGGHHVCGHGHKHHGRRGHGHVLGCRKGHGHGHGCVKGEEQIEQGGQIIVAPASGGAVQPQPQPESSEGCVQPHHHHHHHRRCHHQHGHRSYHQHCGQVTEAAAPIELSGAIVRMHLEDLPIE